MKKGLRQLEQTDKTARERLKHCPDEEGIKTRRIDWYD